MKTFILTLCILTFFGTTSAFLHNPLALLQDVIEKVYDNYDPKYEKPTQLGRGINGGFSCATCTILLSMVEQLAQIHNETTTDSLQRMCTYLPKKYQVSFCLITLQTIFLAKCAK